MHYSRVKILAPCLVEGGRATVDHFTAISFSARSLSSSHQYQNPQYMPYVKNANQICVRFQTTCRLVLTWIWNSQVQNRGRWFSLPLTASSSECVKTRMHELSIYGVLCEVIKSLGHAQLFCLPNPPAIQPNNKASCARL